MVSTLIVSVPSKLNVWFDFYFILIEIKIKFQYYVCSIFHSLEFEYALFFYIIILEGKFSFSKDNGDFSFLTPLTPLMMDFSWIFLTTLSPMSDLLFGLQSLLYIHIPALTFRHLAGGTVPSSGWRLARYRPIRHLATYYALRWRGWLPKKGDSSSCILFLRPMAWYSLEVPVGGAISAGVT